jgi:hypothetical protein
MVSATPLLFVVAILSVLATNIMAIIVRQRNRQNAYYYLRVTVRVRGRVLRVWVMVRVRAPSTAPSASSVNTFTASMNRSAPNLCFGGKPLALQKA